MRSLSILMDVAAGVIDVLKNVSPRPIEPRPASDLIADLGFDSLQVLELVTELEDRFDIAIPPAAAPTVCTVADVVAQVEALRDAAASGHGCLFIGGDPAGRHAEAHWSYADLHAAARGVSERLLALGPRKGDVVALAIDDAEPFLTGLCGVSIAG